MRFNLIQNVSIHRTEVSVILFTTKNRRPVIFLFLSVQRFFTAHAERCVSYDRFCLSDRLTVCHTLVSCQNYASYDYVVFNRG